MDDRIAETLPTISEPFAPISGVTETGLDPTLALARRLADRLACEERRGHDLRLAHALMLDVIELLEASVAA